MSENMQKDNYTEKSGSSNSEPLFEELSITREQETKKRRWLRYAKNVGRIAVVGIFMSGALVDREGYFEIGIGENSNPYFYQPGLTYQGQEAVNDLFHIKEDSTAGRIVESLTVQDSGELTAASAKDLNELFQDLNALPLEDIFSTPVAAEDTIYPGEEK